MFETLGSAVGMVTPVEVVKMLSPLAAMRRARPGDRSRVNIAEGDHKRIDQCELTELRGRCRAAAIHEKPKRWIA